MIITSTANFKLEDGSEVEYNGCRIMCEPTYMEKLSIYAVRLVVLNSTTDTVLGYGYMEIPKDTLDTEAGSESGGTTMWFTALQDTVVNALKAISFNSAASFVVE